ncbi:ABC transporter ATP-binding protein [Absicoccus porci]|uniref:ABC transporter ATP-binding protein n=1 Tax=Absicoccus porci TaxID=2486576 RepID=A0A3N0I2N4_9FIRM|nr:ABC-F family ATP-binding cassette domain-containing protein [Absicoccus porci]RNM31279.1 ABC transporter ATP-binding protein [Absicoccus porci]
MVWISVHGLKKTINDRTLFEDVDLTLEDRDKVALVGTNGTGKSTLLRILATQSDYDQGEIICKKGLKIAYLPQNPVFEQESIWDEIHQYRKDKEDFEVKSILTKLGFSDFSLKVETLSGGQKKRLALAIVLLQPCDVLLLDEPTNHLDEDMVEWLENYLQHLHCALFMVTHDRYFLESVCTKIVEIDQGHFYVYSGNYEAFLEAKAQRKEREQAQAHKAYQLYKKELAWVRAGVQARSTKQQARLHRFEDLRKERFMINEKNLQLTSVSSRLGKETIEWEHMGFQYGTHELFHDFSYRLKRNDRIGIIGPNGCGKSTLLNLLDQDLQPTQGSISYGQTVRIGYFRQGDDQVDLSMRAIDYIEEVAHVISYGKESLTASQMMERFLFDKKMYYMPLGRLSGGERRRLYLCRVLMQAPNILLLDEPTNDLDIMTLEVLEDYLDAFSGAIITVSHDRYFLDRVCDSVFVYQNDHTWEMYLGGYSDYKAKLQPIKKETIKRGTTPKRKTMPYAEKKELEQLPALMETYENKIKELDQWMQEAGADYSKLQPLSIQRNEFESKLEAATERWMELEEKKEAMK